jgi:hypothetical protein
MILWHVSCHLWQNFNIIVQPKTTTHEKVSPNV